MLLWSFCRFEEEAVKVIRWYVFKISQDDNPLANLIGAPPVIGYFIAPTTEGESTKPPGGATALRSAEGKISVSTRAEACEILLTQMKREKLWL